MAARIDYDVCVSCGACEENCPVGAIAEVDGQMTVDESVCVECGACVGGCPVEAIAIE